MMSRALMLFPYAMISWVIIIAGCNQSTVTPPSAAPPAAPSVPTAVAPAQTVPAPAQVAYAQLTRDLASKVRDLASMYRSFVGREATQDDLKESDRKLEQIEQTANKLLGAAAPSEAAARALEKGVVSELDAAIHECTAINSLPTDQLDSGLTRGHPMVAVNVARRTRLHLLQALYPETVDTASTAPDSTAQLNSEAGGDSGFSAGNSPTEMPRAGEKSGTSSEAETAAAKWVNVVDPPQSESLLAGEAIFEITVPGLSARGSHGSRNGAEAIALAHEQALQAGITFPRTAGSVVRVGSNSATGKSSEVWNLATGKRVGTIRKLALEGSEVFAISGDGAYFAAQPAHEHLLGVYDVAASKPLGGIKIEDWSGLKFVAFGVENRLVAFDDNRLKVYTMPDGNLVSTSEELDTWSGFEHAAMSPGGKYVAVHGRDGLESKIRLFNILTGYCDAQLALTREQDRCDGLAFTPNGEQLFLLTAGSRTQIHKFDMATGQQTGTMGLSADADQFTRYSSKFYDGPRLAVFPDGARVMLSGMYVFDAVSGDYLLQLPEDVKYWVGIVGDEQLAVLNGNKLVPWTLRAE